MSKKYLDVFLEKATELHNGYYRYDIPPTEVNSKTKIDIICPKHGVFSQTINNHLCGKGCMACAITKRSNLMKGGDLKKFIEKSIAVHGDKYDYSSVEYTNPKTKIGIVCPVHGIFIQRPDSHLAGCGCKQCSYNKLSLNNLSNTSEFVSKSSKIHDSKYSYGEVNYIHSLVPVNITCEIHGPFTQKPQDHLTGRGCRKCASMGSKQEDFIEKFLIDNNIEYIKNDRSVISPKELDFIIPSKNLAIECHGLYWHSTEKKTDKKVHLNKLTSCESKNYRVIQIFEDEILTNPKIVINRLSNILGLIKRKIYARKCEVCEIDKDECDKFLKKYHIQSSDKSSIKLGLLYKGRLVSVMTFSKPRKALGNTSKYHWELVRFCSVANFRIIGGASKLLSFFNTNFLLAGEVVVSYADRRWSTGDVYNTIGFSLSHFTSVNYWYFKPNEIKRLHRFSFRKSKLLKLGNFEGMTESQIMKKLKYYKIYDCGNMCYTYTKPKISPK